MQLAGNLAERVSRKQSSLNLSIFLFLFCFIEKFESSLNFESSLRFFSAEFSVEFSFSRIFLLEFQLSAFIYFCFLGKEVSDETKLLANFFLPLQHGSRIRTESSIVVHDKKEEVTFWYRIVWGYFSLLHSGQIKCCTWSTWFFLRNEFFKNLLIP